MMLILVANVVANIDKLQNITTKDSNEKPKEKSSNIIPPVSIYAFLYPVDHLFMSLLTVNRILILITNSMNF